MLTTNASKVNPIKESATNDNMPIKSNKNMPVKPYLQAISVQIINTIPGRMFMKKPVTP